MKFSLHPHTLLVGMQAHPTTLENSMEVPKNKQTTPTHPKLTTGQIYDPAISLLVT